MTLVLTVLVVALVFEYINGFHDTANSIATVVSTKVLSPRQAIVLAASTNLLGALWGTAVAKRRGLRRATVAVARKLGIILHRMWVDSSEFRWRRDETAAAAV